MGRFDCSVFVERLAHFCRSSAKSFGGKLNRMSDQRWNWTTTARMPSRPNAHRPHMQQILEELKRLGWEERDLFGIELALEESLSNAIRHGNQFDENKQVMLE